MALKPCRECGREVSTEAKSCPNCGAENPVKKQSIGQKRVGTGTGCLIILGIFLVTMWVASLCSDNNSTVERTSTVESSSALSACEAAFRNAAAVDDMHDTVEDLDPAIRACRTVAEWSAASARYPGALDGVPPEVFLRNRCDFGGFQTPICDEILGR